MKVPTWFSYLPHATSVNARDLARLLKISIGQLNYEIAHNTIEGPDKSIHRRGRYALRLWSTPLARKIVESRAE